MTQQTQEFIIKDAKIVLFLYNKNKTNLNDEFFWTFEDCQMKVSSIQSHPMIFCYMYITYPCNASATKVLIYVECISSAPFKSAQTARFTWPTWGPPGSCWPQVGPILAPWTLLSGSGYAIYHLGYGLNKYCYFIGIPVSWLLFFVTRLCNQQVLMYSPMSIPCIIQNGAEGSRHESI